MKRRHGEEKLRTVESWIEQFGHDVWALIGLYTGTVTPPVSLYESVIAWALKRYSDVLKYPSPRDAVMARAAVLCNEYITAKDSNEESLNRTMALDEDSTTESIPLSEEDQACLKAVPESFKVSVFCYLFSNGNFSDLSDSLLLPERTIRKWLDQAASHMWQEGAGLEEFSALWADLRVRVLEYQEKFCVPPAVQVRARKILLATYAELCAKQQHQGPVWLKYGMLVLLLLSIGAVSYGVASSGTTSDTDVTGVLKPQVDGLPKPLDNLPGTVLAQFELPNDARTVPLDHLVVTGDALYLPVLKVATDTWPSILVQRCDMAQTGKLLMSNLQTVSSVDMIPPVRKALKSDDASGNAWIVKDWNFYVTGDWGVVVARWVPQDGSTETITQVYDVHLPTGKSGLVEAFDAKSSTENTVIAVGDGKVVVQSSVDSGNDNGSSAPLSLPVDVYTLSGTVPLKAFAEAKHISAPFGMMMNPTITGDTLVFQGIQGQSQDGDTGRSTWYSLSWDGQLTRFDGGPPVDGRPHWAVKGTSGKLWWVETTPSENDRQAIQILMSPLTGTRDAFKTPAVSLSDSVSYFNVDGPYVAWVQRTDDVTQLVVGELQ